MAKISALSQAMLVGADDALPIVQAGDTRQAPMTSVAAYVAGLLPEAWKGNPGGSPVSVGLFLYIKNIDVPNGTDLILTSGHSRRGVGPARYRVGDAGDPRADETRFSTNTRNGRPVYLIEDFVTVEMFGAWANHNPADNSGLDSWAAFDAGITYCANNGGIDLHAFGPGFYKITRGLPLRGRVTLRGRASIQGGPGMIYCYGPAFLDTGTGGYPIFNVKNIAACGGNRLVTNFMSRATPGVWAYGVCEDNYFVNFNDFDAVILGVKFFKNNWQNLGRAVIGGADMLFIGNYANLDELNTSTIEVFWQFGAAGATDFSHNYFTCFRSAANDPIVLDIYLCDKLRVMANQLDGGTACTLRLASASHGIEVFNNRLASLSTFSEHGRVPILLNQDISDATIRDNWCANLEPGAPFITYNGGMYDVIVVDNITRDGRHDTTKHDYSGNPPADGSRITMTGPGLPNAQSLTDGGKFRSLHFNRLWTNDETVSAANPRINYIDMGGVRAGDVIHCFRSDPTRRWLLVDQAKNAVIYDSDAVTRPGFRLVAPADGQLSADTI